MVLLMAGFGAELMHKLTHLLKTREIADMGPFSEGAVRNLLCPHSIGTMESKTRDRMLLGHRRMVLCV